MMVLVSDDVVFAQNPGRGFGDKNQGWGMVVAGTQPLTVMFWCLC